MEDLITTNEVLSDVFQRLKRLLTIKGLDRSYKITLNYGTGGLEEIEIWIWNQGARGRDDKERFELSGRICRKLKLAAAPSENYSKLEAKYEDRGIKVRFLIFI